ncbi:hypothetical protein ACHHYP_05404 [Achlya hypogyna]|uniref:F-box domain-containing protein n=1 Tax=Achlya hypogyna TaxID=1202772 RepID=A0A1V9ZNU1_ACHHY|nr:hypothetical protein ACHHYP_05404 [Achlya hypogyna]
MPPRTRSKRSSDAITTPTKRLCSDVPSNTFNFGPDVFAKLVHFLQPSDALSLSSVSKGLYAAMDNRIWRSLLVTQCHVKPEKLKPKTNARGMLATLLIKNRCEHCRNVYMTGCKTLRVHTEHYGKKLCKACTSLPLYREISQRDAIAQYGIEGWQLAPLPSRLISSGFNFEYEIAYQKKMYNLQAVLDLVQKVQSSAPEPKDQEIAHTAARQKFKLQHYQLHTLPHRLVAAGNGYNRKLYNLQEVMDLAAAVGSVQN